MQPQITGFFDNDSFTVSYVVADPATRRCAVIDTVLDFDQPSGKTRHDSADRIVAHIRGNGLTVDWVLETHVHADHLSAAPYVQEKCGGRLGIGEQVKTVQDVFGKLFNAGTAFAHDGSQFDHLFKDGEKFTIGELEARVMHTPGHTPACLSYLIGDAVFVGDTLFMPDYGTARCDFPGGEARQLYRSIRMLFALPDETRTFLCHDYKAPGRDHFQWVTSMAEQRTTNVHVHEGISEDDFVAMRTARDKTLDMPRLIIPSVQVNMRAGHLPPPENNGISYLKIPLNAL